MFPVADSFGMKFRNILNYFDSEDVHRVLLVVFFFCRICEYIVLP